MKCIDYPSFNLSTFEFVPVVTSGLGGGGNSIRSWLHSI